MTTEDELEGECPKCRGLLLFIKSWKLKGKGKKYTQIFLFKCSNCPAEVRIPVKREGE